MKKTITLIFSTIIATSKILACIPDCWAEKLGYPCCKGFDIEVVSQDFDGKWGVDENGNKCGILEIDPRVNCLPIFPEDKYGECTVDQCYDIKRVDADGTMWGYDKENNKRCKINPEICQKITSKTCWSALIGYSCCSNPTTLYKDESGLWSIENNQWCGVEFCPRCNEVEVQSVDRYGNIWSYDEENGRKCIINKKSSECNFYLNKKCKFNTIGYMCCNETKNIITRDSNGFWGIENGKWCGFNDTYPCSFYEKKGIKCCNNQQSFNLIEHDEEGIYTLENGEICGLNNNNNLDY